MASSDWLLTMKPSFLTQLMAVSPKEAGQIHQKLAMLTKDPTPDAKVKKQLKHMDGKLHRLRSGDFRIFYTFESPYISILSLVRRDDDTYEGDLESAFLGGAMPAETGSTSPAPEWERWMQPPTEAKTRLPHKITAELLTNLGVPEGFHGALVGIKHVEDLLGASSVPDEVLLRLHEAIVERPLADVLAQPDLVATDVDDLLRFKSGDLLGFLLKLNPAQEKYVSWAKNAKGPTLLKGGPGTGKSTVALYRARTVIEVLRKRGVERPRILFTTYTNALVSFSKQLLDGLLGDDASLVDVRTADSLAMKIAHDVTDGKQSANQSEQLDYVRRAVKAAELEGNALSQRAQRLTLERLPQSYLLDEFVGVIAARGISARDEYARTSRSGREVPLNRTQRRAVWAAYEQFRGHLTTNKRFLFGDVRAEAARRAGSEGAPSYDGVIVDEAQDLDPVALRMLVNVARSPSAVFLTADANQSIYGSGFRWSEVHEALRFTGRTGVLQTNHRSTKEIDEAAHAYLAGGELDREKGSAHHVNSGPLPAVRAVATLEDEAELLARYLPAAARDCGQTLAGCAVLCPSKQEAQALVDALERRGTEAQFMNSRTLELRTPGVKVLPLKAAKGLEFPVVAIAGFRGNAYPHLHDVESDEQALDEELKRERRTLFVAMTRAMRALLVLVPTDTLGAAAPLLEGFDETLWNLGTRHG